MTYLLRNRDVPKKEEKIKLGLNRVLPKMGSLSKIHVNIDNVNKLFIPSHVSDIEENYYFYEKCDEEEEEIEYYSYEEYDEEEIEYYSIDIHGNRID